MKFSLKEFLKIVKFGWVIDSIKALPTNGVKLASTHDVEFAAYKIEEKLMQFNTIQVFHSTDGSKCWKTF
jgi:GMP synthase (glutamine-hydrolysing)